MERPALSICLIVQNEEEFLKPALESIKDIPCELIIVDTGSTDNTIKIAQSFNAKIFHEKWDNDFAKARNRCLLEAKGRWILFLDADEELEKKSIPTLINIIKKVENEPIGYSVKFVNQIDPKDPQKVSIHYLSRLFPSHNLIAFEGKIHEKPINKKTGLALDAYITDIIVRHYGYTPACYEKKNKLKRNNDILIKAVSEEPKNYLHRFYLGQNLIAEGKFDEAILELKKTMELAQEALKDNIDTSIFYYLSIAHLFIGDPDNAVCYCEKALSLGDDYYDIYFNMGKAYAQKGNIEKAIEALEIAANYDKTRKIRYNRTFDEQIITWKAINEIAYIYINKGEYEKAFGYYSNIFKTCGYNLPEGVINDIGSCFIKLKNYDKAIEFLLEAKNCYPLCSNIYNNLGVVYMEKGDLETAGAFFIKSIKLDEGHDTARYNCAIIDFHLKNYDKALINLDFLINKKSFHMESLMFKAGILFEQEEYVKSIEILNVVIEKNLYNIEAYEYLEKNYRKLGQNDIADKLNENLKKLNKIDPETSSG